jgi:hypothetical protein
MVYVAPEKVPVAEPVIGLNEAQGAVYAIEKVMN